MTAAPHSFKIMHLSHVVDYPMHSEGKDLHMEHSFCLQTTIGGIVYYVHCRGTQHRQSAIRATIIKGPNCGSGSILQFPSMFKLLSYEWTQTRVRVCPDWEAFLESRNIELVIRQLASADMINNLAWHSYVGSVFWKTGHWLTLCVRLQISAANICIWATSIYY